MHQHVEDGSGVSSGIAYVDQTLSMTTRYRVAVGGFFHETNTYADASWGTTSLTSFGHPLRGQRLLDTLRGTESEFGGVIEAAEGRGVELVPLMEATASPSGTIERATYETLAGELIDLLRSNGPYDACYLGLHGAGVVEGISDLEGDLGRRVREVIGPIPFVASLDLHANVSDLMVSTFDSLLGYRLYPHTDMHLRGRDSINLLADMLDGKVKPTLAVEHVPMLLPTSTTNPGNPAATMNEICAQMEKRKGVLDCAVMHGFPYTDIADVGVHVLVTTDNDAALAKAVAEEVGQWVWDHRDQFRPEVSTPELAVRQAMAHQGLVVINETNDNPGAGAPGDGTHLLKALLAVDHGDAKVCFGCMFDPAVVKSAIKAGVGQRIVVDLGGKHDALHGAPIRIDAYVKAITDGVVVLRAMGQGLTQKLGPMVRLDVQGISIIVSSKASQVFDPGVFELHGIDVRTYDVVALKSSQHFRAGFGELASMIVTSDAPGLSTLRIEAFDRVNHRQPVWPLHPEAAY
jgi:microcystin degradation protein MlrC